MAAMTSKSAGKRNPMKITVLAIGLHACITRK